MYTLASHLSLIPDGIPKKLTSTLARSSHAHCAVHLHYLLRTGLPSKAFSYVHCRDMFLALRVLTTRERSRKAQSTRGYRSKVGRKELDQWRLLEWVAGLLKNDLVSVLSTTAMLI